MTDSLRSIPISIQIRTIGIQLGQEGYELVRTRVHTAELPADIKYQEHESGPEIIFHIAYVTAVVTLAKSVLDLITALVKLISERIRNGREQSRGIEIIARIAFNTRPIDADKSLPASSRNSLDELFDRHSLSQESVPLLDDSSLSRESIRVALEQAITRLLASTPSLERARRITSKTTPLTHSKKLRKNKSVRKKKSSLNARRRKK